MMPTDWTTSHGTRFGKCCNNFLSLISNTCEIGTFQIQLIHKKIVLFYVHQLTLPAHETRKSSSVKSSTILILEFFPMKEFFHMLITLTKLKVPCIRKGRKCVWNHAPVISLIWIYWWTKNSNILKNELPVIQFIFMAMESIELYFKRTILSFRYGRQKI